MKTVLTLSAMATMACVLATPAMASDARADAAIRKIEMDMPMAHNADESVKDYDPQIVVYDMMGNTMTGRDVVRDDFAKLFTGMTDVKVTISSMTIDSDHTLGFAFSIQHMTAKSTMGGPPIDIVFRQTDCLHKVDGKWLVINQHISVPFDPTNGRAVFNAH